jgi:hypothetical protein
VQEQARVGEGGAGGGGREVQTEQGCSRADMFGSVRLGRRGHGGGLPPQKPQVYPRPAHSWWETCYEQQAQNKARQACPSRPSLCPCLRPRYRPADVAAACRSPARQVVGGAAFPLYAQLATDLLQQLVAAAQEELGQGSFSLAGTAHSTATSTSTSTSRGPARCSVPLDCSSGSELWEELRHLGEVPDLVGHGSSSSSSTCSTHTKPAQPSKCKGNCKPAAPHHQQDTAANDITISSRSSRDQDQHHYATQQQAVSHPQLQLQLGPACVRRLTALATFCSTNRAGHREAVSRWVRFACKRPACGCACPQDS